MNVRITSKRIFQSGEIRLSVPGDKSISHRALIFGALASGKSEITGLLRGADVLSTWNLLRALGVEIQEFRDQVIIHGVGITGFKEPDDILNCGNSGTTIRLLMGLLAAQSFRSVLTGDDSLCARPMKRIALPLAKMGAEIQLEKDQYAPVIIRRQGAKLKGIDYELPIASAQLKSALLIAGLLADGVTTLTGKIKSRDHSERLLTYFGAKITGDSNSGKISIEGARRLEPRSLSVPGDPSSAAFWIAAACLLHENKDLVIENVLLNPTRLGFVHVLERMGADIKINVTSEIPEPCGTLTVKANKLRGTMISAGEIPSLIDEIPILAILGSQAEGVTEVRGAEELRVKESDRIESIARNLRAMGVTLDVRDDGFTIEGPQKLRGAKILSYKDHRIAMAFSMAGLISEGKTEILDSDCVKISYPDFYQNLGHFGVVERC